MRRLALDPGKLNSWFVVLEDRKLVRSGRLRTPDKLDQLTTRRFLRHIRRWLKRNLPDGGELVIERYQHRSGGGGNVSEVMNAIIYLVSAVAIRRGINVVLVTPSTHKNSFNRFHRTHYPRTRIEQLGMKHGTWRPKLKRTDPCQHVMDAATLGYYRVFKAEKVF